MHIYLKFSKKIDNSYCNNAACSLNLITLVQKVLTTINKKYAA